MSEDRKQRGENREDEEGWEEKQRKEVNCSNNCQKIVTGNFSGPSRAVSLGCLCACVSR